ncbi:uncharacterized protein LOC113237206 isoform X2 [Hyposmocoma kahamanoa]|uniref:uncharacterized protein LOC113237206 isoform X2 n=1 Tax=Hyposmocoma kahamanoa TaxID=1477025 RepID=UPI000E6DA49B|nr:uncharacterized protein LOC113237206 isoform X2 [Hyposmocoma kahamanoa]
MIPTRFTAGQSSSVRKSRIEAPRPSMLPKPRRPASTDRPSTDARRPSATGRSSSAEPGRATLAVNRLSKDSSVSKIPPNRRSKSQQGDRYGQSSITPLRGSQYPRTTATPVRTPSEDRSSRSWQISVDRALAFVTVKDQRPITNVAWQRAEFARVSEALAARGAGGVGPLALIRPLTITRFVEISGQLLNTIMRDAKLNNDNYVAKLPNLAKRFLYPGAVSKSWLKTVNTLHAFPHALAFISYFLNLVTHIETPVSDEWLYNEKDELACLRRDYINKSWVRFQEPEPAFDDLVAEYLEGLKRLLDYDERRVAQLQEIIQQLSASLEDPGELAARAEEERVRARRDALAARAKGLRARRAELRAQQEAQRLHRQDRQALARALDADVADLTEEIQQLKAALAQQQVSVEQRARLLDEVDYATRVADSKRTLADQVAKMLVAKETELAAWQKRTLDSCVEYQQALIHLAAHLPPQAALAVDEKELMEPECAAAVARAAEALRAHAAALAERRASHSRARAQHTQRRAAQLEETRAKIAELKATVERLEGLRSSEHEYNKAKTELEFWEAQDEAWRKRLSEMQEYIVSLQQQLNHDMATERRRRADLLKNTVNELHQALAKADAEETDDTRSRN